MARRGWLDSCHGQECRFSSPRRRVKHSLRMGLIFCWTVCKDYQGIPSRFGLRSTDLPAPCLTRLDELPLPSRSLAAALQGKRKKNGVPWPAAWVCGLGMGFANHLPSRSTVPNRSSRGWQRPNRSLAHSGPGDIPWSCQRPSLQDQVADGPRSPTAAPACPTRREEKEANVVCSV